MRLSGLARAATFTVAAFFVGITTPPLRAVDVVGDEPPEYLQESVRPNWRLRPLSDDDQLDVLDEIEQWISKPLSRSEEVQELDLDVILLEETRLPLREVLELLERTQDLHFTAEPLRLVVQTGNERRSLERRLVDLGLRDFGFFFEPFDTPFAPDPVLDANSSPAASSGSSSIISFGGDDESPSSFDLDVAVELVESMLTSGFTERSTTANVNLRGNGNLLVNVSPNEETTVRAALQDLFDLQSRRSRWRLHVGRVPRSFPIRGGLVSDVRAKEIAKVLEDRQVFELNAFDGQNVAASRYWYERSVDDVDVNQTGVFPVVNPSFENDLDGVFVHLRPTLGLERRLVEVSVEWVERRPASTSMVEITAPPAGKPASADNSLPESGDVGRSFTIGLDERWKWNLDGAVFLREKNAMVWSQMRGDDVVAIIVEEVAP